MRPAAVLLVGLRAGVVAGIVMAVTLMAIGEIANEPTVVQGIDSSTWTALTGIASFFFGTDAFHGSFQVLPILAGLAIHLAVAATVGAAAMVSLVYTQGPRPGPVGAMLQNVVVALSIQTFVLALAVDAIQEVDTVYGSIPRWGWWAAHAAYGGALGLGSAALLRSPVRGAVLQVAH